MSEGVSANIAQLNESLELYEQVYEGQRQIEHGLEYQSDSRTRVFYKIRDKVTIIQNLGKEVMGLFGEIEAFHEDMTAGAAQDEERATDARGKVTEVANTDSLLATQAEAAAEQAVAATLQTHQAVTGLVAEGIAKSKGEFTAALEGLEELLQTLRTGSSVASEGKAAAVSAKNTVTEYRDAISQ